MFRFTRSTNLKQDKAQSSRDSTHKGVDQRSKVVTQAQQQRPESPTENVPLAEFLYLVFTRMPGESYLRVPLVEFMYLVFTRMPGESYLSVPLVEFMYLVFTRMPRESYLSVPVVEFMYLVFTRMPGESYRRRVRSLLLSS